MLRTCFLSFAPFPAWPNCDWRTPCSDSELVRASICIHEAESLKPRAFCIVGWMEEGHSGGTFYNAFGGEKAKKKSKSHIPHVCCVHALTTVYCCGFGFFSSVHSRLGSVKTEGRSWVTVSWYVHLFVYSWLQVWSCLHFAMLAEWGLAEWRAILQCLPRGKREKDISLVHSSC